MVSQAGLDMFDCVLPTRNARNGQFLTANGPLNIKKERFKEDLFLQILFVIVKFAKNIRVRIFDTSTQWENTQLAI